MENGEMKEKIEEGSTSWQMLAYFHCLFWGVGEKRGIRRGKWQEWTDVTQHLTQAPHIYSCVPTGRTVFWHDDHFCYIHRSRLTKSRAQEVNRKL